MFSWKSDPAIKALVAADVLAMIATHGTSAYHVASERAGDSRRGILDLNRPPGHWNNVRREIARRAERDRATRKADG